MQIIREEIRQILHGVRSNLNDQVRLNVKEANAHRNWILIASKRYVLS
jgi:hypothetical protein